MDSENSEEILDLPKTKRKSPTELSLTLEDTDKPTNSKISQKFNSNLWIEKHRPKTIADLVLDPTTLNKIEAILEEKNMPNIIITGVPGIGKTTTILCIAKNLFGKYLDDAVLELNASDDRGVKIVQGSIEYFCKKRLIFDDETKYANHKIVILDEADNMTKKAQQSINNLMENYHKTTRFAFTCNNSSDIIEAIQSRCIIFRYCRLTNQQITDRLKYICKLENVQYNNPGIESIVLTAQGDLRHAINNLQLTYNGYKIITAENVYKLCDKPHPLIIQNIFLACLDKNISTALKYLYELYEKGYSSSDISISMFNTLKNTNINIPEPIKIKYMNEISKTRIIISRGLNTQLQLTGSLATLCNI